MRPDGRLHVAGVAFIQRVLGSPLDGEDIQRIFDPDSVLSRTEVGLRLRWREQVVSADVRSTMRVRPARLDSAGEIAFTGERTPGLFASTDGPKFVLVGWTLGQICDFLAAARSIYVDAETFEIGGSDIRDWTIARFLAYALRENGDPELAEAYVKTHVHYLSQRFTDPLQMVSSRDIAPGALRASPMTLSQFWGLAGTELPSGSERSSRRANLDARSARSMRRGLPMVSEQILMGTQHWFDFLFGGESFVGDLTNGALRTALETASSRCEDLPRTAGIKYLAAKKPDVVQILVGRRRIEVLDATMRPFDRWHNFKTEIYAAVLRAIMGTDSGWYVAAMDFKSQQLMSPLA